MLKTLNHFRRKLGLDRKMNEKNRRTVKEFSEKTKDVPDFYDLSDFLLLLDLAEYGYLGKSRAILLALKVGYLAGKEELRHKISEHFGIALTERGEASAE